MTELKTFRVQRLNPKPKSEWHAKVSQAFGGGMLQLSAEGWKVIQGIFDFDYMGAAEYEFGSIPDCLKQIVQNRESYRAWSFPFQAKDIKPNYWRERSIEATRRAQIQQAKSANLPVPRRNMKKLMQEAGIDPPKGRYIYVFSPTQLADEDVIDLLKRIADGKQYTKAGSRFGDALDPDPYRSSSYPIGWLDVDNQFFWFTDEEVWKDTVKVFKGEETA